MVVRAVVIRPIVPADEIDVAARKLPTAGRVIGVGAAAFLAENGAGLAVIDHFQLQIVAHRFDLDLSGAAFHFCGGKSLVLEGADHLFGGDGCGGAGRQDQRRGQQH